jgi:L-lactate dehydrogenase complex protein LldG
MILNMTKTPNPAREEILGKVRMALLRRIDTPVPPIPSSTRVPPRIPGAAGVEIELLLNEIGKLGGHTRRIAQRDKVASALAELVRAEEIYKATAWETAELAELGVADILRGLGVELVSPHAGPRQLAGCDLGVTSVDAALPETGTLLLRSTPERSRLVSLLPRVHLALVRPSALRADLGQAFADVRNDGYFVFVTGPSRTADIELTVTIGVHGPKALHVWSTELP